MQIYFRVKYSLKPRHMHTLCTMNFFSLYRFTLYQYHESKPHYFQWYSWAGSHRRIITQYNGSIPWWLTLVLYFTSAFFPYTTWYVISRVHTRLLLDKYAYALRHTLFIIDLAHTEFLSSLPSVLTIDTSFDKFIKTYSIKHNFIK